MPLPQGLSQSIHGRYNAPWMPRASACPQGGVPASPHPPPLDDVGKLLRWNGCGCWDVLRWCPAIAHQRRGPRSGQLKLPHCACGAITSAPSCGSPWLMVELLRHQPNPHEGSQLTHLRKLPPAACGDRAWFKLECVPGVTPKERRA